MSVAGRVCVWLLCLVVSVPVGDLLGRFIGRLNSN